jgi:hypothetical protein
VRQQSHKYHLFAEPAYGALSFTPKLSGQGLLLDPTPDTQLSRHPAAVCWGWGPRAKMTSERLLPPIAGLRSVLHCFDVVTRRQMHAGQLASNVVQPGTIIGPEQE